MQQLKRPSTMSSKVQPATEHQKVSTEATRYDYLKKAAEQLMKSQVSSKAELSSMETKLQRQQNIITLQTTTVEKLREEKTKLQSILQSEKQQYERLKFDMIALTTITSSLKKEMTSFASDVAQADKDKNELIKENETLRIALKRLESEVKTAIDERDGSKEQLMQRERELVVASSAIARLETENRETKEQLNVAQTTLDSLRVDALRGREELKKTASELCSVRGELSSLDERCTVLQIIERDLTNSLRDKDNALGQSVIEMKAMEREKLSRIAELESQLSSISSNFDQLKMENASIVQLKASLEEANIRTEAEKTDLCATVNSLRADYKALEARWLVSETNCHSVNAEKQASTEQFTAQLAALADKHSHEVEALKSEFKEKLNAALDSGEEKTREVVELQATIDSQRREFSLALASEIQKQKELYQSQIDQLQRQLQGNEHAMENLRGSPKEAVKEANPLELLDEDESDEVLSGSRDIETVRKVAVTAQQHRVVHELAPKKVYAPASKQKKITKPQVGEQSKRFTPNVVNHKKMQGQQVNQRSNKTKKKSKKTLDLFDDVFAFHG